MNEFSNENGNGEKARKARLKALVLAGVFETLCIGGGVAAFLYTDKPIWLVIGVIAGVGFSVPALIRFVRSKKEHDDAS